MTFQQLVISLFAPNLFLIGSLGHSVAQANENFAVFELVKGEVQIQSARSGQLSPATVGAQVYVQDTLIAAQDSRARIRLGEDLIHILPETKMKLEQYLQDPAQDRRQVLLNVISGKVRAKVEEKYDGEENQFQIRTPTAVAGVRGTDFLTGYNNGITEVLTFSGEVEFGLPGPGNSILGAQVLGPGTVSRSVRGAPPSRPQAAPADLLEAMEQELIELEEGSLGLVDPSGTTEVLETTESEVESESGSREPAQASPDSAADSGEMLLAEDLPGSQSAPPPPPLANLTPPSLNTELPRSVTDTINQCEFCNRVIEEGTDRLIIRWTQPK